MQPEIILTTSFFFELPVNFQLGTISYNSVECELLDIPKSLSSTAPEMRRIRFLRTKHSHTHVAEVGDGFPNERDVFSSAEFILTAAHLCSEKYTAKKSRERSYKNDIAR